MQNQSNDVFSPDSANAIERRELGRADGFGFLFLEPFIQIRSTPRYVTVSRPSKAEVVRSNTAAIQATQYALLCETVLRFHDAASSLLTGKVVNTAGAHALL